MCRWLGDKGVPKKRNTAAERNIFTAPAGASKYATDSRDAFTAPAAAEETNNDEMIQVGIFFRKKRDVDPNKVHMDIYSKRNMYSSLERERVGQFSQAAKAEREEEELRQKKWEEEAERQRREKDEERARREQERRAQLAEEEERRRNEAADALRMERRLLSHSADSESMRRQTLRAEMRRIAGTAPKTELEKREARIQAMNDNAELMKDLLIKNAKKRAASRKKKKPIEDRIRTFFTKMEDVKAAEALEDGTGPQPTTVEQKRRYVLMTKGVKAALEIKDDDDEEADNPMHTL